MTAMTFAVAAALALVRWRLRGERLAARLALPPRVWALGVVGLFGYHALYFTALALAPPVEANLINYLWPLLIVLLSGLLPGQGPEDRLRWWHVAGALLGLAGAAVLIGGGGVAPRAGDLAGYGLALGSATVWAGYSVLSRRSGSAPGDAIGAFCLATALLALACHLAVETTVAPASAGAWLALAALGAGPVGIAFAWWDVGMKRGDIRVLGGLAYLTPLASTLLLVAFGRAAPRWTIALACALIAGGAALAGRALWQPGGAGRPRAMQERGDPR
jgi:drug/metabolite transporter (DMT)-like permease